MVSTRQMTIGNNGAGEGSQSPNEGPAKFTRNSTSTTVSAGCSSTVQYSKVPSPSPPVQSIHLLDLPQEIIEKIFSYIKFKNICQMRLVSLYIVLQYFLCSFHYVFNINNVYIIHYLMCYNYKY